MDALKTKGTVAINHDTAIERYWRTCFHLIITGWEKSALRATLQRHLKFQSSLPSPLPPPPAPAPHLPAVHWPDGERQQPLHDGFLQYCLFLICLFMLNIRAASAPSLNISLLGSTSILSIGFVWFLGRSWFKIVDVLSHVQRETQAAVRG